MATFAGRVENHQIVFVVWVSRAGRPDDDAQPASYRGLLDTGAQVTMISEKVVRDTGLQAIGHMRIVPVTGVPEDAERFRLRIDIPIDGAVALPGGLVSRETTSRGMDMDVGLLPYQPDGHDVLLGMDFISAFHLTMYGGNYILSN